MKLAAKNVTKAYSTPKGGRLWALDGVTLSLGERSTHALVGESGCGKSTLAKLLLRLEKPTGGSVEYEGRNLWEMDVGGVRAYRRAVQMIFQDPYGSLNPRMKAGEIVAEPLVIHNLAKGPEIAARAEELLERVGLPGQGNRYPKEFSGGQRQRIGIARALAMEPKLIIADEPVSALDVSVQAQILNLLADLKEERDLKLLLISHDLRVVRAVSDRISVMYLGKIVEEADTADFFREPRHPYSHLLLDSIPEPDVTRTHPPRTTVPGDPPSPVDRPGGCPFNPRCPSAHAPCFETMPEATERSGSGFVKCHLYK